MFERDTREMILCRMYGSTNLATIKAISPLTQVIEVNTLTMGCQIRSCVF